MGRKDFFKGSKLSASRVSAPRAMVSRTVKATVVSMEETQSPTAISNSKSVAAVILGGGPESQPGAAQTQAALQVDQSKSKRAKTAKRVGASLAHMHKILVKQEAEDYETEIIKVPIDVFTSFFEPTSET